MKILLRSVLAVVVIGLAYYAYLAYQASRNLVTLNVRNMDVREVIKKIERQTWETIIPDPNTKGKVTLDVRRMPLEAVLEIIGDQTSARWSSIYALYSTGQSLVAAKRSLRGEIEPAQNGWTNLQTRGFRGGFGGGGGGGRGGFGGGPGGGPGGSGGPGGAGGMPGDAPNGDQRLVSLRIESKDVHFATLALNRFTQTRVVPEDGVSGLVTLKLDQVRVPKAVAQLAKQAHRNWIRIYAFRGEPDRGGPGELASREGGGRDRRGGDENGDRRRGDGPEMTDEQLAERRKEREALEEELKQTLPPTERAKLEEQQQQREQQREEFANMTPEQRSERFQQLGRGGGGGGGGGGRDQRMMNRIKNSTPEQRVDRYREMKQRRDRWQPRGQGPGR